MKFSAVLQEGILSGVYDMVYEPEYDASGNEIPGTDRITGSVTRCVRATLKFDAFIPEDQAEAFAIAIRDRGASGFTIETPEVKAR